MFTAFRFPSTSSGWQLFRKAHGAGRKACRQ